MHFSDFHEVRVCVVLCAIKITCEITRRCEFRKKPVPRIVPILPTTRGIVKCKSCLRSVTYIKILACSLSPLDSLEIWGYLFQLSML